MPTIAIVTFSVSLVGLILLFGLKFWEEYDRFRFFPKLRRKADERALALKEVILHFGSITKDSPRYFVLLLRVILHALVVTFANVAGAAERGAHRVADFVSHRHRFERKETSSDFLKKVRERKEELAVPEKPAPKKRAGKKGVGKKA